ncbi:hypothetical protein IU497_16585 [Nocardia terpenica]|nr:hypothetical protein [Nocardia terpenica]
MSDKPESRDCPSWCAIDVEPEEPDEGHRHSAAPVLIPIENQKPTRLDLYRYDRPNGERSTTIQIDLGDGVHELSIPEATKIAYQLAALAAKGVIG